MNKNDVKVYRDRLVEIRERLRGDVSTLADSALRQAGADGATSVSMPIHMAELGSENFEQEFTLSLMEAEEDAIMQVDAALQRIEDGTFGVCTGCNGKIPKARLNAIPYTPVCVKCAETKSGS